MLNINFKEEDKLLLDKAGLYFNEENLSHAYIFEGDSNSVQKLFEAFCRRVFRDYDGLEPANEDISNIEDLLIEDSDRIGIDRVREIISIIYRKPLRARHRIIFLKNAGNMLEPAQNALLKSLEEPPDHLIWVLGAVNRAGLLDTIRSRCRSVRCPQINNEPSPEESEEENFAQDLLLTCIKGQGIEVFMNAELLDTKNRDFSVILKIWIDILSETLEYSLTGYKKNDHTRRQAVLKELAGLMSPNQISLNIIEIEKTGQGLKNNWNQLLALENLCLKLGNQAV